MKKSIFQHTTKTIAFLATIFCISTMQLLGQEVVFRASAPNAVVEGEQFRLTYSLNKEGKELRIPSEIKGFQILFGPSTSSSYSTQIINGKATSSSSFSYTYILMAEKKGTYNIAPASIKVDGSNYTSNALTIKVLPPEKSAAAQQQNQSGAHTQAPSASSSSGGTIKASDAFIRAIVTKSNMYEQEGFMVSFKLYTTLNVVDFGKIEFPEFEGFMVEEINIPGNQQLQLEHYNGRNYYTAFLKKNLLFPQRAGKMKIPSGRIEMVFSVASGKRISSFFGTQEVMTEVKKGLTTNPITVNVKPLPAGKPDNFTGAVGNFSFSPSISTKQVRANEPITITLKISGTGNLKLFKNPKIDFPSNFEVYDPTIDNNFAEASNGLRGTRKIEYLAIPRYEGNYTIAPIKFSYFDVNSKSYKTLQSSAYDIQVAKDDASKAVANNYATKQEVKVEKDIRFLKTGKPNFQSSQHFFAGSTAYWLWYMVPTLLLLAAFIFYRKQAKANANITLMRNRRANKVAVKRLKTAGKYLKAQDKAKFYDEVLRAVWGYFSDKLSIPVANLTKDNIEAKLSGHGIDDQLIDKFMHILNTCEFARYAPSESDAAMDNLYRETETAIGEMERELKRKNK